MKIRNGFVSNSSSSSYIILKVHGNYKELQKLLSDDLDYDTWFASSEIGVIGYNISHSSDYQQKNLGNIENFIKVVENAKKEIQKVFPGKETSIVHFEYYG